MLTKGQLKDIFLQYKFRPLKRFGENYLVDGNIKDKIIGETGIEKGDTVLEIGPGLGALTIDLAQTGARVFAVEKDRKAFEILRDLASGEFSNLILSNADILEYDFDGMPRSKKIKVLGNLPYYATTPILELLIRHSDAIEYALIVIQKEVAARLIAGPGGEGYGALSCFIQYHAKPSYIYTIKRTCFYPSPAVDSSLIKLEFLERPPVKVRDEEMFFRITRGAFNQRRKSIINSLSRDSVLGIPKERLEHILDSVGIDSASRPEQLSLFDFAKIANSI